MPDRGEILMPTPDEQVSRLALIEAIRANTDAVNRMSRHSEMTDRKLDEINRALGKIDTRLTVIENDELKQDVADHEQRLRALETELAQRQGANKLADALVKYGPFAAMLVTALFIILIATGRIVL